MESSFSWMDLFWPVLIVSVVWGGIAYACYRTSKSARGSNGEPVGFGGWLLLLVILQTLTPLRQLIHVVQIFDNRIQFFFNSARNILFWSQAGPNICVLLFMATTTFMMYWRSAAFKHFFGFQAFAGALAYIAETTVLSRLQDDAFPQPIDLMTLAIPLVLAALWYRYLFASIRARNTFVR
jgi:hypothetical protein